MIVGQTLGQTLLNSSAAYVNFAIEPFLSTALSHSTGPSVFPRTRKQVYLPTNMYLGWIDPAADELMHTATKDAIQRLKAKAIELGQDIEEATLYPNYAIDGIPVETFWGKTNVKKMQALKAVYDPKNVMGLTGGWKV
jgi:FAD/FMN-containing dehydrogenase